MRDELGRVLCPHGRIMACAECGDDYERELQGPAGGARGDALAQSPQSTGARAFVQELATLSMTAQSDRRASSQVYRSALVDICNRALKWLDAMPPPPPTTTTNDNFWIVSDYPQGGIRGLYRSQIDAEAAIASIQADHPDLQRSDFSIQVERLRPAATAAALPPPQEPLAGIPLEELADAESGVPPIIRRELLECATANGRISYHWLLRLWKRGVATGRELSEGVLSMTVDRLGGMVEGRPTARVNFLQRIDELRRIEASALSAVSPVICECGHAVSAHGNIKPRRCITRGCGCRKNQSDVLRASALAAVPPPTREPKLKC